MYFRIGEIVAFAITETVLISIINIAVAQTISSAEQQLFLAAGRTLNRSLIATFQTIMRLDGMGYINC